MSEEPIESVEDISDEELEADLKRAVKRDYSLVIVLGLGIVIAPFAHEYLSTFRGVVLSKNADGVLIYQSSGGGPLQIEIEADPGEIVHKESGEWSPTVVEATEGDAKSLRTYKRYISEYEGFVTEIIYGKALKAPDSIILQHADGKEQQIEIWGHHLARLRVGKYLRKIPGEWEARIVPAPEGAVPPPPKPKDPPAKDTSSEATPKKESPAK